MTTELFYPKRARLIDDGCDWTALIIWRMNAGARARSKSAYFLPPIPEKVINIAVKNPPVRSSKPASGRTRKTHTGTIVRKNGPVTVKLHETATAWSCKGNENYDKNTGYRIGSPGRARLLLETLTPIEA